MATIKSLTKANANKYGIEVREDLDFTDDGSRFRGFSYKGLPLTQCVYKGETFLAIRVDYLEGKQFTTKEWMETEEYKLADEFNGCNEIDTDKLIENLERIIAKVDELNKTASEEVIDLSNVISTLIEEIQKVTIDLDNFKANFKWYKANKWTLQTMADYTISTENAIEYSKEVLNKMCNNELDRRSKKEYVERLTKYGYVRFEKDYFYTREMKEALDKQN